MSPSLTTPGTKAPCGEQSRHESLFDDLVRAEQNAGWNGHAESFGSFEVEHKLQGCGLLDRDVGALRAEPQDQVANRSSLRFGLILVASLFQAHTVKFVAAEGPLLEAFDLRPHDLVDDRVRELQVGRFLVLDQLHLLIDLGALGRI